MVPKGLKTLVFFVFAWCSAVAFAQQAEAPKPNEELTLNLQNADIGALIETVSYVTGKNFIVDPRVTAKVTVVSAVPTQPDKLYDLFLSILKVHGYAAVDQGSAIKIVPDVNAKQESVPTLVNGVISDSDQVSTLVIDLQNVSANELIPIIRPLLPQSAHLAAHENVLIAADSASNLKRLTKIINRIDRESNIAFEIIHLQHANAADLVDLISPTLRTITTGDGKQGASATSNSIVADERTNSILLVADRKQRLEIRALISHLDTPAEFQSDAEVIYLKYAVASEMVPILEGIGGNLGIDANAAPGAQGNAGNANRNRARGAGTGNDDDLFDIQADDNVNALIIHAPPKRLTALKSIIAQLDIRRAQVLVEGVIAEISYDKSIELGVQWRTSATNDGGFVSSAPPGTSITETLSSFDPLSAASGLAFGFFSGGNLRGLLRAISGDNFSNVLSTPSLVTLDNEEAEIVVGQNVPFVTGQFTNNTTSPDNPFQTIERQDVGIVLKVKPQINDGDSVRLEIEQEISSVAPGTGGAGLITNKRSITTNVLVDDQQIIVLGGLLQDDINETQNKIPVVGDIPIVGNLFRNTNNTVDKTNLMVFLRPQIIRDSRTSADLTNKKYNFIRDEQENLKDQGLTLMVDDTLQELPEFEVTNNSDEDFIVRDQPERAVNTDEMRSQLENSGLF